MCSLDAKTWCLKWFKVISRSLCVVYAVRFAHLVYSTLRDGVSRLCVGWICCLTWRSTWTKNCKKLCKVVLMQYFIWVINFKYDLEILMQNTTQIKKKINMVRSTLLQCVSSTGLWLLRGHLLKCVTSTPKLDVLNDLKSSSVVFALSSQYYLLIQSIRRYVTEFRSGALAEHVVPIDVRLERKIAKNCAKSFWCNISYDA